MKWPRFLLEEAETQLTTNRYDTDRPRLLAMEAKHNALHAKYVSKLQKSIRDKTTNLEVVLLEWEASISKVGDVSIGGELRFRLFEEEKGVVERHRCIPCST